MNNHILFHMRRTRAGSLLSTVLISVALLLLLGALPFAQVASAQVNIDFDPSGLSGESVSNPTSLQFGPDDRLYVSQQNGIIWAFQVERNAASDYSVVDTETIELVQDMQNHDDDDGAQSGTDNRQITGIYVTGTGANPVLYVSSSDPRIGAGGGGNDKNLDTNSGILSKLTCTGGIGNNGQCNQWEKVDLVRGFPRSEENHATNGMQLDEQNNILYLAIGGHTNAGAPSNNFAFTVEYTYSSTIVAIDLDMLEGMPVQTDSRDGSEYVYDLPTLDDPTRENVFPDGSPASEDPEDSNYSPLDVNDPFGGNDGLNMAKIDPTGPVSIFSPGWRNLYDIVITEQGRMYGVDNGANGNWGGHPDGEADYPAEYDAVNTQPSCTNEYLGSQNYLNSNPNSDAKLSPTGVTEPGSTGQGPGGDDQVNNKNGLHYIRPLEDGDFNYVEGGYTTFGGRVYYYGGHPHPILANPTGAGIYTKLGTSPSSPATFRDTILDPSASNFADESLPVDWPPVPPGYEFPSACDFRNSGQDDNALANYGPSTNGIAEYTASNFNGAMQGNLLLAGYNGNIYEVELSENGKVAENCPTVPQNGSSTVGNCNVTFASGFGSSPLDVIAQGDNDVFGGTVWAVTYGSNNITVFEPSDYNGADPGTCEGTDDDTIDEDGDLYTNADEIANGTNQCSSAAQPADFDDSLEFGANNEFKRSDFNDNDDDDDGIPDVDDPFNFDPDNGTGSIAQLPLRLEFFNSTGYGFGNIGLTGIMINGNEDYFSLVDDSGDELVFGGTAGIYTDPSVAEGDAFSNTNTQKNGFQFGIDVDAQTGPFLIESQINGNPFFGGDATPDNFASQGIYIGTGDQDNFLKFVLTGNVTGEPAGFQIAFENNGTVSSDQKIAVANILDATAIQMYLTVDPAAGTVQASYGIDGGLPTNIGNPVTVSGDVLAAVQGTYQINGQDSGLAVGTIATSTGAAAEFGASWDYFDVYPAPSDAQAFVKIDTNGINGSTFNNGSFNITNNSATETITNVTFDLSTAMIPEVVLDPNGDAGDATAKGFTPNNGSDVTTGVTNHSYSKPYEGGFYGLSIDFDGFDPGETLQFGLDVDPISIKGGGAPGPNESGSVSGLELAGTTVTVTYSTGETQTVQTYRTQPDDNSDSENIVTNAVPAAPSLSIDGVDNQSVVFSDTVGISVDAGDLNAQVYLLQFEAGMFVDGLSGPNAPDGYNVDPWETNSIIGITEYDADTGNGNVAQFSNVELTNTDPEAGYNIFAAVVVDPATGATSDLSNVVIVKYDPDAAPQIAYRVNTVQETIPSIDDGPDWVGAGGGGAQSGDGFSVNTGNISTHNITNRHESLPDYAPTALFTKERWDPPAAPEMLWNFEVPNGTYTVNLFLSNGFGGTSAPGARVFDIEIEGELVEDDFGPVEAFGHQHGGMKSYNVSVTDGSVDIEFLHVVENPNVNAIEILAFTGDIPTEMAIEVAQIDNQTSIEGDDAASLGLAVAATGGDGNLTYSATGLPDGVDIEPTNGQILGTIATGAAASSPYTVEVTVDDSDDNPDDVQTVSFLWTVTEEPITVTPGEEIVRVNSGGAEYTDTAGNVWEADNYFVSGNVYPASGVIDVEIAGTEDDLIYQTERSGAGGWEYQIPVPEAGTYVVEAHFAEIYFGVATAGNAQPPLEGKRVFTVAAEGVNIVENYDINGPSGPGSATAIVETVTVDVIDGTLNLVGTVTTNQPKISGFVVYAAGEGSNDIVVDAIADQTNDEGDTVSLTANATGGDGTLTYLVAGLPTGLSFDQDTGEISGTIAAGAAANSPYNVTVTVDDNDGDTEDTGSTSFVWTVNGGVGGGNTLPTITLEWTDNNGQNVVISDQPQPFIAIAEKQLSEVRITADDPDVDDVITFSAAVTRDGDPASEIDLDVVNNGDSTGAVNVLADSTAGDGDSPFYTIVVTANDGVGDASSAFSVVVNDSVVGNDDDLEIADADLGQTSPGQPIENTITIENMDGEVQTNFAVAAITGNEISINDLEIVGTNADAFTIVSTDPALPAVLGDGETLTVTVQFQSEQQGGFTATLETYYNTADNIYKVETSELTASVSQSVAGDPLICVNVGGTALTAFGRDFLGDSGGGTTSSYFTGGTKFGAPGNNSTEGITALDGSSLTDAEVDMLQTERFGGISTNEAAVMTLTLDSSNVPGGSLPNGDYVVDMYFAEIFVGVQGSGTNKGVDGRVFDVTLQGDLVLDDYDIFDEGDGVAGNDAGAPLKSIVETFNTSVTDGTLTATFKASADNAKISAFCLSPATTGNQAPIVTNPGTLTYGVLAEFGFGRLSVVADDPDGPDLDLTFGATGLPTGLTMSDSGEIQGTIAAEALENGEDTTYSVTVTATDTEGAVGSAMFDFVVINRTVTVSLPVEGSTIPTTQALQVEWTSTGGDPSVDYFDHIHLYLNKVDDPAISVDERIGSLPLNGTTTFTNTTVGAPGDIANAWAALFDEDGFLIPGEYVIEARHSKPMHNEYDITVALPDTVSFTVEEAETNAAPEVVAIEDQRENVEGNTLTEVQVVTVTDPEDDNVTYAATGLPTGLTMDTNTGLVSGTLAAGSSEGATGAFIESNGLVVIEMESADSLPNNWEDSQSYSTTFSPNINDPGDATGGDFIVWQAGQSFGTPGNGLINYPVQINTPGTYKFQWRNQVGNGTDTKEHNDTWVKIEADQFYGWKNGGASIVCPKGAAAGTCPSGAGAPNGAGANGWFKVYSSGANNWSWSTSTSDNDGHGIYAEFNEAGTYNILISARSNSHAIDRMVLFLVDSESYAPATNGQLDTSTPESERVTEQIVEEGAAGSYNVVVEVTDDGEPSATGSASFVWDVFPPDEAPGATISVNAGGGLGSSTFGNNSFQITNTGNVDITNITIDSSTAFMFDVVFDPVGKAGDNGAKCLTTGGAGNTATEVGLTVPANGGSDTADCESVFSAPHNGVDDEEGYDVLTLDFTDGDGFNPGESYAFGVDMDPTSIKGDLSTGDAGSISGFELIGSRIDITFANGTVLTGTLGDEGSLGGSQGVFFPPMPSEPQMVVTVQGLVTPTITNEANQTILITNGKPNEEVELIQIDARLYIDPGNPTIGYDVDPFEANEAMAKSLYSVTLDENGSASIPVTLLKTAGANGSPDGGLNHFIAYEIGAEGQIGIASERVIVEYDPEYNPQALVIDPASLEFTAEEGEDTASGNSTFVVTNTGDIPYTGSANISILDENQQPVTWASVASGTTYGTATSVMVNPTGLSAGVYNATLLASGVEGYADASIPVTLTVTGAAVPSALVEINPTGGLGASTYDNSSFQITNTAPVEGGASITSISIDLSTGILPDMVFDPVGAGGDATSSCLTQNNGTDVGITIPANGGTGNDVDCVAPFSVARNGGFDVMTVNFTDFGPGEQFFFTTDIDPNSIQDVSGAGFSGAVSGYELTGATVTVTFSNGATIVSSLYEDGSLGGSQAVVEEGAPSAPSIKLVGQTANPVAVADTAQQIMITGEPNAYYSLLQMDSRLYIASGDAPFDVDPAEIPFYANEAMSGKEVFNGQLNADGEATVDVTLLVTDSGNATPDGGLNQFIAVTSAAPYAVDTQVSQTSNSLTVLYDETAVELATLTGNVTLQGRTDHTANLTVGVYTEAGVLVTEFTPTSSATGEFTVTGMAPGTYQVAVKHSQYLQVVETITLVAGDNTADFGQLAAGDANDDNIVDGVDFSILSIAFNAPAGTTNYDARADFNASGTVDGVDFSLLSINFNIAGEELTGN